MELHEASLKQLITVLHTDPLQGLSSEDVVKNRTYYKHNMLSSRHSLWSAIRYVTRRLGIYGVMLGGLLTYAVLTHSDIMLLVSIVMLSFFVAHIMREMRAYKALRIIEHCSFSQCTVVRNGNSLVVDNTELVIGDLIILMAGQRVPADARIVQSEELQVYEASLTGVHNPVAKFSDDIDNETPLRERINMVFKGTYISSGWGKGIVVGNSVHAIDPAYSMTSNIHERRFLNITKQWLRADIFFRTIPMACGSLLIWYANYADDVVYATTMAWGALVLYQITSSLVLSNEWTITFFIRWALLSSGCAGALYALLYTPALQIFFNTVSLSSHDWTIILYTVPPVITMQWIIQRMGRWFF